MFTPVSPARPTFDLRDYGDSRQIGLEKTEAEYIAALVEVFGEVKRVLHPSGTLWIVIGDSYTGSGRGGSGKKSTVDHAARQGFHNPRVNYSERPKCLRGIPWKLAFALHDDGWYWRSNIVWAKSNPLPHPVKDRCSSAHEEIVVFSKCDRDYCDERVMMFAPNSRYFYDQNAIREPHTEESIKRMGRKWNGNRDRDFPGDEQTIDTKKMCHPNGRNRRDVWFPPPQEVWVTATANSADDHTAVFQEALVEPMVMAGSSDIGCCSGCGAPWRRKIEVDSMEIKSGSKREVFRDASRGRTGRMVISGTMVKGVDRRDVGWEPTCEHKDAPIDPCVVLDPFNGIGTTGMVAVRRGRRYIGIDLCAGYIVTSHRRIAEALEADGMLAAEDVGGVDEKLQLGLFG